MNGEVLIDVMTVESLACALKTRRPPFGETRLLKVETGVFCPHCLVFTACGGYAFENSNATLVVLFDVKQGR